LQRVVLDDATESRVGRRELLVGDRRRGAGRTKDASDLLCERRSADAQRRREERGKKKKPPA